jgi:hypothetical protein
MFTSAQNASSRVIDSRKSAWKRLAMLGAFLLSLGAAGFCEAENNLTVTYQDLAAATTTLLTPEVSPIQEASTCASERTDVKAPQFLIVPTTTVTPSGASTTTYNYYVFVFWNVNGAAYSTERVRFYPICGGPNYATAWYRPACDPNPDVLPTYCSGPGEDVASVIAFSLSGNTPVAGESPIASVSGGTWPGSPSTTVTLPSPTASALVDLQSDLVLDSTLENFVEYQLDYGALETSRDVTVHVGDVVIAFYAKKSTKPIPPCPPPGPHSPTCT